MCSARPGREDNPAETIIQRKWKISLEESVFFVYDKYIVSGEEPAFIRISTKQEETG